MAFYIRDDNGILSRLVLRLQTLQAKMPEKGLWVQGFGFLRAERVPSRKDP